MATPTIRGVRHSIDFTPHTIDTVANNTWNIASPSVGDTIWAFVLQAMADGASWAGSWSSTPVGWTLERTLSNARIFKRTADGTAGDNPTSNTFGTILAAGFVATAGVSYLNTGAESQRYQNGTGHPTPTALSPGTLGQSDTLGVTVGWYFSNYFSSTVPNVGWMAAASGWTKRTYQYLITNPYGLAYQGLLMQTRTMATANPPDIGVAWGGSVSDFGNDYTGFNTLAAYISDTSGSPPPAAPPKGWWITKPG